MISKRALLALSAVAAWPSLAAASDLIISAVGERAPVIAYELPEADGRAEAVHYVESVRDQLKPGSELLDLGAGPAAFRAKLANGFILFTTLSDKSSVLLSATRKLGWDLSSGSLRWREVSAPAGELRLVLIGENPYAKGYCVVYAAGSNRALAGIQNLRHGGASYAIYQGNQLLRAGLYDGRFRSIESLPRAAAIEDANQFFHTLQRVHPKLLAKVSKQDYRDLQERTRAGIAARLDARGDIPVADFASLLYYAGAFFHDGHTSVDWATPLNDWNTRGRRFPAFRLEFDNGRFVVAAARDRSIAGMELVEVNGAQAVEFLRPILDRCSGETLGFRAARFLLDEPFWYYLTNLFGAGSPYRLKLRDAAGQPHEATLETLDYAEYQAFLDRGGDVLFRPNRRGTAVEFFDSGETAHFLYSSFHLSGEEKQKIDRAFQEVHAKGSRNLIVDVRGNGGGESGMGEYLFRYLYGGKFRALRVIRVKVSWDILHQFPFWARPVAAVLRGRTFTIKVGEHSFRKPDAFFSGHTYLLTDNGSYSMAGIFAAMFRDYHAGTILGYETGGLPNTFGGPHHFRLKNSGIACNVAWTQNLAAKPWPGDDEHGVIPDVPMDPGKLAEFRTEQDPVLSYTLRYIHNATPQPAAPRQ